MLIVEKVGGFTERTSNSLNIETFKFFVIIKKYKFKVYFYAVFLKISEFV